MAGLVDALNGILRNYVLIHGLLGTGAFVTLCYELDRRVDHEVRT